MSKYTTIKHPRSGEVYGVRLDDQDNIVEAANLSELDPLRDSHDDYTLDEVEAIVSNQPGGDLEADAEWLTQELGGQQ